MGRAPRIGSVVVALVAAVVLVGAAAASAQTTPTQPRTAPTTDPKASTFPVLQTADLPAGYRMGSGSPFQAPRQSPIYPTIEKCVWDFDNPFSGLTPEIYQTSFQQNVPVSGIDIAIVFDAGKPALSFYDNFVEAYRAAEKCKTTKAPSSSGSSISEYGTVEALKLPKLGDASFGALVTPPSKTFPPIKQAFIRDGTTVVSLRVTDPEMSVKEFGELAELAAKRAA